MMKVSVFFVLILYVFAVNGQTNSAYFPLIQNIYAHKVQNLNGNWNRLVDPLKSGFLTYRRIENPNGFFKDKKVDNWKNFKEFGFEDAPTLKVPGDWNTQEAKLYYYEGAIWYKKNFNYTGNSARQFLYFGAVNYDAKVYLNGVKIGEHIGGYTPFNIEATKFLKKGDNAIIVLVDNVRKVDAVPTDNFDWWNYGGITRDVMLVETPQTFINDYKIQLKKTSDSIIEGFVQLNGNNFPEKITVEIPELQILKTFETNTTGRISFEIQSNLTLWSPKLPKLYKILVSTSYEKLIDTIGFRNIEVKGNAILLNGNPIFLKGICVHEEAPITSRRAFSLTDSKALLDKAQEIGCNFIRLAHYPHNEFMIREAERRGILLWSEIPVYWTIDFKNPVTLSNATNQLNEIISRDKNRASVIVWSVANETPQSNERDLFLSNLIAKAKEFDNTRLVSMALEKYSINDTLFTIKDNMLNLVDIVSFNQYIGWYGSTWEDTKKVNWSFNFNKPIIMSEFGGEALYGKHGNNKQRWTEEYQNELYVNTLKMLEKIPNLVGITPWILMDFRSPKRLLPKVQDDFNRKGLFNEYGQAKKAMFTLKSWYKKR